MRYKDIFTTHYGIFYYLNNADNVKFTEIFGNTPTNILKLDTLFLVNYGDRTISPLVNNFVDIDTQGYILDADKNIIASLIWFKHYETWKKFNDLLSVDYDVLQPYNVTNKLTNEIFDFSDTTTPSESITTTRNITGNGKSKTNSELIKDEIAFRNGFILMDNVFSDIRRDLTISIYD